MRFELAPLKQAIYIAGLGCGLAGLGLLIRPSEKQMGILQMDSYLYEDAERRLLSAYAKNPKDLIALQSLSRLYEILGRPQEVIRYLKEYVELRPKDTKTRLELAKVYLWNLQQKPALNEYLAILDYEPGNIEVLRRLASAYAWNQQPEKAIGCYIKIGQVEPLTPDDQRALVQLYIGTTQLNSALALMEKMHRQSDSKLMIKDYTTLADIYVWTNRVSLADMAMDRMLDELKSPWDVRMAYVNWYMSMGKAQRAIFWLERWSRREDDLQVQSHEKLISILQSEFMELDAIASMERLVANPKSKESHRVQLFWMYFDSNNAEKTWTWGLSLGEELIVKEKLLFPLAQMAKMLKKFDKAEEFLLSIISVDKQNKDAHKSLLSIYQETNNKLASLQKITWLLQTYGTDLDILEQAIEYYSKEGQFNRAITLAQQGSSMDSNNPYFLSALVTSCASLEKWDLALAPCQKLLTLDPKNFNFAKTYLDILIHLDKKAEGVAQLKNFWKTFASKVEPAHELAQFCGWLGDYKLQFEYWMDLESREPQSQYEEQMLEAAMASENYVWALGVLQKRKLLPTFDDGDFNRLLSIYRYTLRAKEELELLQEAQAQKIIAEQERRQRISDLYFELGKNREGLLELVAVHEKFRPQSENSKAELAKKSQWVDDPALQEKMLNQYGKLNGADGVILADLAFQKGDLIKVKQLLANISAEHLINIKAQNLLRECAIQSRNLEGQLTAVEILSQLESNPSLAVEWQLEKASLLNQLGRSHLAENAALAVLVAQPDNARAKVILAYIYYDQKRYPQAADMMFRSGTQDVQDRFLRGASLLRFPQGYREGERLFHALIQEFKTQDDFRKWNMVLNIGYELNSPFYIERAWDQLMTRFFKKEMLPRYALHLLYTERRSQAEAIYKNLPPSDESSYLALQKIFEPNLFKGVLNNSEKMALSDFSQNDGHWLEATQWLP